MVTRKDVAERAGVSVAVVSYVMNNKLHVKESTRRKVLQAMAELNYRPNLLARSLKTKKAYQLAVLVHYLGDPFEAGILHRLEQYASEAGYFTFFQRYQLEREEQLQTLFMGRVDGIILLGQSLSTTLASHFLQLQVPVLSITRPVEAQPNISFIDIDWAAGMSSLLEHLQKNGHVRVGFMSNRHPKHHHHVRYAAFREAVDQAQLEFSEDWLLYGDGKLQWAYDNMRNYLARHKRPPFTAIICANDLMAAGVLSACKDTGISVPKELAVAGCENILMSSQTTPNITTLHYPRVDAANVAIKRMLRMMEESPTQPENEMLPFELFVRASTTSDSTVIV